MRTWRFWPALFLGLALLAGCSDGLAEVSGKVTIDGKPLEEGEIVFEEADQSKTPAAAKIANGEYVLKTLPGNKKVRVNASRPMKKPDPVLGAAARESMVAVEYNEKTKLTATVKPGKQSGVDFEVKGVP